MLIESRQALISYQDYHMVLLTLTGRSELQRLRHHVVRAEPQPRECTLSLMSPPPFRECARLAALSVWPELCTARVILLS